MGRSTIVTEPNAGGLALYWIVFGFVSISFAGLKWLWRPNFEMAVSALGFAVLTAIKPPGRRAHGIITTLIVTIAATAYYAMAAGGGDTFIPVYYNQAQTRDIFYARYIDWVFTTPLLLLDLLLMTSVSLSTVIWIMAADLFMIIFGLFGAVSTHHTKWGWFGVACFFEALIAFGLLVPGIKSAFRRSRTMGTFYMGIAAYLSILWWGYPIVWGLAEGSNTISADAEIAAYGGLDIAAKVIFGWIVMIIGTPIIDKAMEGEDAEGRFLPRLLESPINAPLSLVNGSNVPSTRKADKEAALPAHSATNPASGVTEV